MRAIKLLLVGVLAASFMMFHSLPAQAKGPVNRILITGGNLTEEIAVTDMNLTALLSMGYFEDFETGEVEAPQNPGEGYELVRQFKNGATYTTFDRTIYYPERGYVHYIGIENGSSEYDGKWFRVTPEGDMAMQRVLSNANLTPYVAAISGTGEIYLLDPETLEQVTATSFQMGKEWAYVSSMGATADGQKLLLNTVTGSGSITRLIDFSQNAACPSGMSDFLMTSLDGSQVFMQSPAALEIRDANTLEVQKILDLPTKTQLFPSSSGLSIMGVYAENGESYLMPFDALTGEFDSPVSLKDVKRWEMYRGVWDFAFGQFYLTDGEHLLVWDKWTNEISRDFEIVGADENLQKAGVQIEPITAQEGRLFLYPRLGRYWIYNYDLEEKGEFEGGIYVVDPWTGNIVFHWLPDLTFTHVVQGGEVFYALQARRDDPENTQLFMLDSRYGRILKSVNLPAEITYLGYLYLRDVQEKTVLACSTMTEAASNPAVTPPPTATPAD